MAASRFWRSPVTYIVVPVAVVVLGVGTFLLVSADRAASAHLPSATVIEDVPVGGMSPDQAVERLRPVVEEPLRRTMVLESGDFEISTTPWDLGFRADLTTTVKRALTRGADGNPISRLGQRLMSNGEPTFYDVPAAWGEGSLDAVLAEAASKLEAAPENGDLDLTTGFIVFKPAKAGQRLDVDASRRAVMEGVERGAETVTLVTTPVKPDGDDASAGKVILVRTGENKLYLYDNGKIVKEWPVATGTAAFPTPTGVYEITAKILNPSWYNPNSSWSRGMPKVIGPGRNNPLGTKALSLSAPGILIHASPDRSSIGYSASHGCIRMTEETEAELFGMVEQGTRVAIVEAGPPRPRGSALPPATPTPEVAAAVQF
jgi:lipoprotein-anchoring transpeptidase ErfK/SrfK